MRSLSAEETMETVKETVTVPGIKVVETTAQMQAVSQTEQTVEPSGGGSEAMVPEGTEETDREPLKETAKANQIQDGTKPQLPEQASEPMREPEPQEVGPAHEGEAPPSAEPQPPGRRYLKWTGAGICAGLWVCGRQWKRHIGAGPFRWGLG